MHSTGGTVSRRNGTIFAPIFTSSPSLFVLPQLYALPRSRRPVRTPLITVFYGLSLLPSLSPSLPSL